MQVSRLLRKKERVSLSFSFPCCDLSLQYVPKLRFDNLHPQPPNLIANRIAAIKTIDATTIVVNATFSAQFIATPIRLPVGT